MKTLWIATGNMDKAKEMRDLIARFFPEFCEIKMGEGVGVIESADTFLGNAQIKSRALASQLLAENGGIECGVLADDSGLCIDALGGRPGVFSARYAGAKATSQQNIAKVFSELKPLRNSKTPLTARFHCALSLLIISRGEVISDFSAEASYEGMIADSQKGCEGFGYDSIFVDLKTGRTFAELTHEEKQKDSHRVRAFCELRKVLFPKTKSI